MYIKLRALKQHAKMKMKIILTGIVLIAAVLTGCPSGKIRPPIIVDPSSQILGEEGIAIDFVVKSDSVKSEDNVILLLNLRNNGKHSVKDGVIIVPNPYPNYLDISAGMQTFSLEGRSSFLPEGERKQKEVEAHVKAVPGESDFNFIVAARACYPYSTEFQTNVCIDSTINPDNDIVKKVCDVEDQSFSSGQGAPVAITKIEQKTRKTAPGEYSLEFKIHVENVGEGIVLKPDSDYKDKCSKGNWISELSELKMNVVISQDRELKCDEAIINRYHPQSQYYVCRGELSDPENANYVTVLRVNLEYNYVNAPVETSINAKSSSNRQFK